MGKQKYLVSVNELFNKSPVVDFSSIERLVNDRKQVKQYTKQLVRNLLLKGMIKNIAKGYYTKSDDISLAVFCFKPAYLGLQDALSFHNLWEQETIPIIITTKKVRQGIREVSKSNVLIRRMNKKYLFGVEYYLQGEFYLPYSDIEKTFIDMIYFKEKISQEVLSEILQKIDREKLNSYLKYYPKRFRDKFKRIIGS